VPDFAVKTAFTAVDRISPAFKNMESSASSFQKTASRAFMAVGAFVSGYLVNSFVEAASQAERLNTGFKSVFGGDAANQMQFVRDETKRLGLELTSSADAYKGIAAAAKGTAISNADVQQTFLGVSEAAAALQLTGEQSQGALLAISQIISKGKVSMEELRGQLGERIPGAMQIAARSMGVTTAELEKMVASGISAEKFIPKFAAQMRKEFGPAAMDAASSFNASRNRFNNMIFDFKVGIGSVILPMLNDLMTAFTPALNLMVDFFRENKDGISEIVKLIPWLVGGFIAYKATLKAIWLWQMAIKAVNYVGTLSKTADMMIISGSEGRKFVLMLKQTAIYQKAAAVATKIFTAAQAAFNFVASLNPIFLIVGAIVALGAAIALIIINWDDLSGSIERATVKLREFLGIRAEGETQAERNVNIEKYTSSGSGSFHQGVANFLGMDTNMKAPNEAGANLQGGKTVVNLNSNGTEAKAEVTPRRGATVNMNRLGYQQ
jgi:tape measure domain-containing protein